MAGAYAMQWESPIGCVAWEWMDTALSPEQWRNLDEVKRGSLMALKMSFLHRFTCVCEPANGTEWYRIGWNEGEKKQSEIILPYIWPCVNISIQLNGLTDCEHAFIFSFFVPTSSSLSSLIVFLNLSLSRTTLSLLFGFFHWEYYFRHDWKYTWRLACRTVRSQSALSQIKDIVLFDNVQLHSKHALEK